MSSERTAPVAAEVLPAAVLAAWGLEAGAGERELGGLINRTFFVRAHPGGPVTAVIQRLHPVFAAEVNIDLDAVTAHLAAAGMVTPRLLRTLDGARWFEHEGAVWRALTYVDGVTVHAVPDEEHAVAAGVLVGRFHLALSTLEHRFAFQRASVHDTAGHLRRLGEVLRDGGPEETVDLARRVLDAAGRMTPLPALPRRPLHGDLKISNVMFARGAPPVGLCLIDLDTLGPQTIAYEMGDCLRSWCNPEGEDTPATRFDLGRLGAALRGYAAGSAGLLAPAEIASIVPGLETGCVELAARFCVDAFEDRYFGWDPTRFPSRRAHNLVRAEGQLALAEAVMAARSAATDVVADAFLPR
ncbi:MAG TPA: phosphotransferase [Kofleriaceae bacterium]|nr:phosphotransferase [Kofleriaceae bacterium]